MIRVDRLPQRSFVQYGDRVTGGVKAHHDHMQSPPFPRRQSFLRHADRIGDHRADILARRVEHRDKRGFAAPRGQRRRTSILVGQRDVQLIDGVRRHRSFRARAKTGGGNCQRGNNGQDFHLDSYGKGRTQRKPRLEVVCRPHSATTAARCASVRHSFRDPAG